MSGSTVEARWQTAPLQDGRILRFREDLVDGARASELPFVIRLLWPFADAAAAAPSGSEEGAMAHFAHRLEVAAAEAEAGVLTAEVTGAGAREWVWACRSAAALGSRVNALMHEFEDIEVDVEPAHDPEWRHLMSLLAMQA